MDKIIINTPPNFGYLECLAFMNRSLLESLHRIQDNTLYKAIQIDDRVILLKVHHKSNQLICEVLNATGGNDFSPEITAFLSDLFDLERNLLPFYSLVDKYPALSLAFKKMKGIRLIGITDLFEALSWAIIGQQINLKFAYTLKARVVENWGECYEHEGRKYYLFPSYETISKLIPDDFTGMQFTRSKVMNLINLAKLFHEGTISKDKLVKLNSYETAKEELVKIKGIGSWSADYALMKSLKYMNAYPKTDVGLHNAIKHVFKLDKKPSMEYIEDVFSHFQAWEAYLCFYLWRTLY